MKALGLINARGGSKGVHRKNVKNLCGKPLISWSIEAALHSKLLTEVVVSTDDREIANIAENSGASVPFIRPAKLATDDALQIDVIKHALSFYQVAKKHFDLIVILQPTVPLRSPKDIDNAIEILINSNADSLISVCEVGGRHPITCYEEKDGLLHPLIKGDSKGVLRQNFNEVLWRNGAIYAMYNKVIMDKNSLYGDSTIAFKMPEERSFNIDSPFDWDLVEGYLKLKNGL